MTVLIPPTGSDPLSSPLSPGDSGEALHHIAAKELTTNVPRRVEVLKQKTYWRPTGSPTVNNHSKHTGVVEHADFSSYC